MAEDPRVGKVLQGRYKIGPILAEGGMGIVYRGERVGIGRPVVVKFLHTVLSDTPGIVDRFEREARATARLNHPNCVALVDYGLEDGQPYLVMEYAEGKTLADLLDGGALPPRRAVRIARQVLAGLSHAHERGILHRDLKPANIMVVDAVGHTDFVKLLDFGLAKLVGPDGKKDVTVAGIAIGTPGYMSPEQAAGVPSDRRSDIYCTGALLYHLVTGSKAFEGDDIHSVLRRHREETPALPRKLDPAVPISKELEKVILQSMSREPAKRYQSAEEMLEALKSTPEGQRQGRGESVEQGRPRSGSSSLDEKTRAESAGSRARERRDSMWPVIALVVGILVGAGGTVAAALFTPIRALFSSGSVSARRDPTPQRPPAQQLASATPGKAAVKPVPPPEPAHVPEPARVIEPDDPALVPTAHPAPQPATASAAPHDGGSVVATIDDEDDDPPAGKVEDGANEDPSTPPAEPAAAPHRDAPSVSRISDVKQLLRKGDADGALAGLYRLRRVRPTTPRAQAEIAMLIGNIYFDRHWWTDALKEYRFGCKLDPHAKSDSFLVNNTIRTFADHGTFWRARRLVLDYIGRNAAPSLRLAAKKSENADLRRRAQRVLDTLEGRHTTASRSHR